VFRERRSPTPGGANAPVQKVGSHLLSLIPVSQHCRLTPFGNPTTMLSICESRSGAKDSVCPRVVQLPHVPCCAHVIRHGGCVTFRTEDNQHCTV